MIDALTLLIDQEQAKLHVLEQEVATRKNRIATLISMQKVGEFDSLLDRRVSPPSTHPLPNLIGDKTQEAQVQKGSVSMNVAVSQHRKKGSVKNAILNALTTEPQHLDVLLDRVKQAGFELTNVRMRTQLWQFKKKLELVENPDKGYFNLSTKGVEYLNQLRKVL